MPDEQLSQYWNLSIEEAFAKVSSRRTGLDPEDAKRRIKLYGTNTLVSNRRSSSFILFLSQFKSPVTLLLIIAALLSAILGDKADTLIILAIVMVSSVLGFWQEKGAAKAVEELLKYVQLHCSVLRAGIKKDLPVEQVVPGDVVYVSAGDIIPGDCLIIESQELFVDEAAFTGETFPVEKRAGPIPITAPITQRTNTLLMSSHVISGKATAVVMSTGQQTQFGQISSSLQSQAPETDFEHGIRKFGYLLMEITLILVIIIFAINVLLHKPVLDSFLFSLALAVGLTPQLLPAILSVNLSAGARRMARKQVIVKRLSSIENLGSMNILCSDKTGTITDGKVKLNDATDINGNHSDKVLKYAWINSVMQQGYHNPIDEAISAETIDFKNDFVVQAEIPYDFIRKRLSLKVKNGNENIAITKGAVNQVLAICDRGELAEGEFKKIDDCKAQILQRYQDLSEKGLRTLGVAYKPVATDRNFSKDDEQQMIFLGFITLFDPLKKDMMITIDHLHLLGVKLKIITGDNALVAKNLAQQIGIAEPRILTGEMLQKMTNAALRQKAPLTDIFAEIEPNQKERIIIVLKATGNVVGFMGDGINDAPALHAADVGISVDTAVDVAKEAADIVLLSRDLDVLKEGIKEGRKTFTNTMKYIFMATSANFGNMFSMAGASLFLPFLPLFPKQILLTNLLTDFPEMTIATDHVDHVNITSPQRWNLNFIKKFMLTFGLLSSLFDYLTFGVLLIVMHANEQTFQTGWFTESVISATMIVLVVRTRLPFFKSLPGKYLVVATVLILLFVLILPLTPMATWFGFVKLSGLYYGLMLCIIGAYILCAELVKYFFYKKFSDRLSLKNVT